jgi:SIR2-like domain
MAKPPDATFYLQLVREIRRGWVTPFLGAGVNLCGRPEGTFQLGESLPSGMELARYLAKEFSFPPELDIDLLRVTQWVAVTLGNYALYAELDKIFDRDYSPTAIHETLAKLPTFVERDQEPRYPLIMTTNYDDLMERALTESGVEFDVLAYIAAGTDQGKFRHRDPDGNTTVIMEPKYYDAVSLEQRTVVAKIHGAVQRPARDQDSDSYVVTEDDYIDCLTRTDIVDLLPRTIGDRMKHCHYLFLGYSLQDWNLRAMLHRIRREQPLRNPSWVVQPNPEELKEKAWFHRNVDTLDITLEKFSTALDDQISHAPTDGSSNGQLAAL